MKKIGILFVSVLILYVQSSMAQTSGIVSPAGGSCDKKEWAALQAYTGKYSTDDSSATSSFGCKIYLTLTLKDSIYHIQMRFPALQFALSGMLQRDTVNFDPERLIWSLRDRRSNELYGFWFDPNYPDAISLVNEDAKEIFEKNCIAGKLIVFARKPLGSYQTLRDFWPAFQKAVRKNDRKAVVALTYFPLPGVAPFIHADMKGTLGADTAQFIAAMPEIFAAIPRTQVLTTNLEGLLPLDRESFGQEISGSEILLLTVDRDSKIYLCYTEWTENNDKANNQALIFAKVNGSYKLCGVTWKGGIY